MSDLWINLVIWQVVAPTALLVWQARQHSTDGVVWLLMTITTISYTAAILYAGLWVVAPYLPTLFLIVAVTMSALRRPRPLHLASAPKSQRDRLYGYVLGALAMLSVGFLWVALESRRVPAGVVDLEFPLRNGAYYIANGGSTVLTNAHIRTLDPRYAKYRGQSHGVDILKLNERGRRANGLAPSDLSAYAIFGDPIYAPCEGIVARVEDWLPDMVPPQVDRTHMPGNYTLIECDDFQVLLAHMRTGSVRVHPGDYVTTRTLIGEVGNSGNSDEPHLHVHAQRPGYLWDPFVGDPLPIRLDGRYLVRNDRVIRFGPFDEDID
jgi:hypothetical protein